MDSAYSDLYEVFMVVGWNTIYKTVQHYNPEYYALQ
jgi:hypothetical protein